MKTKKVLLSVLSIVLVAVIAIGGTIAYFTDRDSAVNVFTVGNVDIDLEEVFEQGAQFVPGVDIEKIPTITNKGANDAWVWMTVAIPLELEGQSLVASNDNIVHWNILGATLAGYNTVERATKAVDKGYLTAAQLDADGKVADGDTWTMVDAQEVEIDGEKYALNVLKYNGTLVPGETTTPSMYNIYLDAHVDYNPYDGKYYWVEDGVATLIDYDLSDVKVLVTGYAIQASDFANVDEAYEAYGVQWGTNINGHYANVYNQSDLNAAVVAGETIYLAEGTYTLPKSIPAGTSIVGAGSGVVLSLPAATTTTADSVNLGDNVTLKDLSIVVDGESAGKGDVGIINVAGENVIIDGCSFDITGTNSSAITFTTGSDNTLIKNCSFTGGYKHIGTNQHTDGDIIIDNCTFGGTNSSYGMHLNVGSNNVTVKNCDISLFNTFYGTETATGTLKFESCNFISVPGKINVVKLYRDAIFNDCSFDANFLLSGNGFDYHDFDMVFNGCVKEGYATFDEYILSDEYDNYVTVTIDGNTYTQATEGNWE